MSICKRPLRLALVSLFWLVFLSAGCSILTDSQLDAASRQAKVLGAISDVPSGVMKSSIEVLRSWHITQALLVTSDANSIQRRLRDAVNARTKAQELGQRVDIALSGIRAFGEQIEALSSKDFSQGNIDAAKELGIQVDEAAKKLGHEGAGLSLGETPLSAGTIAAAVAQFIGNMYIRNKQSDYLREAIKRGQPAVSKMLDEVVGFMDYISPASVENPKTCDELLKEVRDTLTVFEAQKKYGFLATWNCQIEKQTGDVSTRLVNYTEATAQDDRTTGKRTVAALQPRDTLVAQVELKERIILTRTAVEKVRSAALKQKEVLQKLASALSKKHNETTLSDLPFVMEELRTTGEALLAANEDQ